MKASAVILVLLAVVAQRTSAQQPDVDTAATATNSGASRLENRLSPLLIQEPSQASSDVIVKKQVRVAGPLVHLFKAKKLVEVPRRVLHLINPFAPSEPKEGLENLRDLSPRAWTATVGWHSGGPSFQDPVTHESTMSLISLSRSKEVPLP